VWNDNRQYYKYVCITSNQPDAKSNPNPSPNPNPATKEHAIVNIQLNIVTYVSREIHTRPCCCVVCTTFRCDCHTVHYWRCWRAGSIWPKNVGYDHLDGIAGMAWCRLDILRLIFEHCSVSFALLVFECLPILFNCQSSCIYLTFRYYSIALALLSSFAVGGVTGVVKFQKKFCNISTSNISRCICSYGLLLSYHEPRPLAGPMP